MQTGEVMEGKFLGKAALVRAAGYMERRGAAAAAAVRVRLTFFNGSIIRQEIGGDGRL